MVLEITNLIITPFIGLLGVFMGAKLTRNNEVKIRKEFIVREMRIEKYQELSVNLHEYTRKIASMHSAIVNLTSNEISHKDFKMMNDKLQDEALKIQRQISINKVFTKDLESELNTFLASYIRYCDKIYDGFHKPDNKKPLFEKHEVTHDAITEEMIHCNSLALEIVDIIDGKIETELKALLT